MKALLRWQWHSCYLIMFIYSAFNVCLLGCRTNRRPPRTRHQLPKNRSQKRWDGWVAYNKNEIIFSAELQKYITCIFSLDSRTCHKIKLEVSCRGAPQQRVSCHLALSWSYDLLSPRGHILFVVATVMSILFHLEIFKNSFILSQIHIAAFDCLFL